MRKLVFIGLLLMIGSTTRAQNVYETLVGNKQTHYIHFLDMNLDSSAKWNFFNMNRFTVNYQDKTLNTVSIEGQLSYQFNNWFGISAGAGYYGEVFVPTIGLSLSFTNKKENLFVQMYPTIGLIENELSPSVLGIIAYNPKLNKNWGLTSQIIFSVDPFEASQIIRAGVNFKDKIAFGLGIDFAQNFQSKQSNLNLGPFIRANF
jgi:hypothetical protein